MFLIHIPQRICHHQTTWPIWFPRQLGFGRSSTMRRCVRATKKNHAVSPTPARQCQNLCHPVHTTQNMTHKEFCIKLWLIWSLLIAKPFILTVGPLFYRYHKITALRKKYEGKPYLNRHSVRSAGRFWSISIKFCPNIRCFNPQSSFNYNDSDKCTLVLLPHIQPLCRWTSVRSYLRPL